MNQSLIISVWTSLNEWYTNFVDSFSFYNFNFKEKLKEIRLKIKELEIKCLPISNGYLKHFVQNLKGIQKFSIQYKDKEFFYHSRINEFHVRSFCFSWWPLNVSTQTLYTKKKDEWWNRNWQKLEQMLVTSFKSTRNDRIEKSVQHELEERA